MLLAAICICGSVKAEITPDQYAVLTVKDVEFKAGEVQELELNLKNPIPVSAITTDIILPEGCTFEPYSRRYVQMTERISDTHMASTNLLGENHLRVVMVSLDAFDVTGNDGAIIKFKVNVGTDVKPGEYKIQLAGQQIVTADEQKANDWNSTTTSTLTIKPNEFTVTIKDATNGTVTGAGTYPASSEVTLTATADEGYKFVKWSNEITDNPYKFNITEDVELSAIFEACKYTITYVVDGETYKTVEYTFGAKITPEAAPEKEGYEFSGWSEIPETMPAKDITVTGTFEIIDAINEILSSDQKVDVYNLNGIKIFEKVSAKDALKSLPKGIYIINGQKIYVK